MSNRTADDIRGNVEKILADRGIVYEPVFEPQSAPNPSLDTKFVTKGPKWRAIFTNRANYEGFTFYNSLASIPGYMQYSTQRQTLYVSAIVRDILKNALVQGKASKVRETDPGAKVETCKRLDPPHPADVLYCLIADASAHDQTLAEWCDDYGYSDDSIKAREIYRECSENGLRLIRVLGREGFEELSTALQDY